MKFENEKYFYDTSKSSSSIPIEFIPIEYQVFIFIQTEDEDQSTTTFPVLIRLESHKQLLISLFVKRNPCEKHRTSIIFEPQN